MKIQDLAIIFIIIILPISLLLSVYTQFQIQTINMQTEYDAKLTSATYDAIRAFQLNTASSTTSDLANSKMRDLEASVATFRNSILSAFELNGFTEDELNNYIPALVYTLYDGFYIYSPYENIVDENGKLYANESEYQNIYGLKPYITYSCRYVKGEIDVVITYSLDNYITVQGMIGTKYINESGYLIEGITYKQEDENNDGITYEDEYTIEYNGVKIVTEQLKEHLPIKIGNLPDQVYPYVKINGVKYYRIPDPTKENPENNDEVIISFVNGEPIIQYAKAHHTYAMYNHFIDNNNSAKEYYKKAAIFTQNFKNYGLDKLTYGDARVEVVVNGEIQLKQIWDENDNATINGKPIRDVQIFVDPNNNIENETSIFNQHRLAIIRHKIETNLAVAISNYNSFSNVSNVFQMPELKENEWDDIINNISLISFLQGLPIGGKLYNGYSLVTNSESEEVVLEENIYILGNNDDSYTYNKVGDKGLEEGVQANKKITVDASVYSGTTGDQKHISAGRLNIDCKRKDMYWKDIAYYYYPLQKFNASYNSVVMQNEVTTYDDIYKYINKQPYEVKQAYYIALGRERESIYRDYNVKSVYGSFSERAFRFVDTYDYFKSRGYERYYNWAPVGWKYGDTLLGKLEAPDDKLGYYFVGWYNKLDTHVVEINGEQ